MKLCGYDVAKYYGIDSGILIGCRFYSVTKTGCYWYSVSTLP